jgi:hypothetical protein
MRTAKVTINGQPHEVQELRARDNAAWRKSFETTLGGIVGLLGELPNVQIETPQDIVALVTRATPKLLGSIGAVYELCCQYDKAFGEAYDSECIDALSALLGLAYPFGAIGPQLTKMLGSATALIKQSSPAPNGESGTTK